MLPTTIHVLVPFWGLAGGVIKILDYAEHASALGITTTLWAPPVPDADDLIHTLPVVQRLRNDPNVAIEPLENLAVTNADTVLFTEPTHHELIERSLSCSLGARLIHLVQGTRHANPRWHDGRNYRLLHRPMTRISVSVEVSAAISPLVNAAFLLHTIPEGHDTAFFSGRPASPAQASQAPLRVLYTTWKSDLGDRVAAALDTLDPRPNVACIAVREAAGWPTLRNRYHGADVLLCTPGPQEGFYLPGLEAMAAGVAVVTALVGGNAAYVESGHNALVVPYDDVNAHVEALRLLASDNDLRTSMIQNGYATLKNHTLSREREAFGDVLRTIGS